MVSSDFYAGYSVHAGDHQRCWAHFLRDVADLVKIQGLPLASLHCLAKPYLSQRTHPFHTLAKRVDRFLDEMFTFALDPDIPSTNNQAERSLRPVVIARKISGGTRSPKGSQTKATLATLFGTWNVRNLNPLVEGKALLTDPNYAF